MDVPSLQVLTGSDGSVTFGWLREGVLYVKYRGVLSAELGGLFARKLDALVKQTPLIRFYGDAGELTGYDLLARSAFVRIVLANRRRFSCIVLLTWTAGLSAATRAFAETFGEGTHVLVDADEFHALLRHAAPDAGRILAPKQRAGTLR